MFSPGEQNTCKRDAYIVGIVLGVLLAISVTVSIILGITLLVHVCDIQLVCTCFIE